jgi:type IV secretory pathway TrbF-like protein
MERETSSSYRTQLGNDFVKNPFQIMKHQTISVQIESILQASPESYEVR